MLYEFAPDLTVLVARGDGDYVKLPLKELMGVTKSLRTIRDCDLRDEGVRRLADRLLKTEQDNIEEMKRFL